jgi:hypothetical protein
MLFTLEILQAKHGDCLIIHYSDANEPKILVVDGGPSGIYNKYLKPRLLQIKKEFSAEAPLNLEMVMISHADDDHINGIKMLTQELVDEKENLVIDEERTFKIKRLWFNAFDDIIGNNEIPMVSTLSLDATVASTELHENPELTGLDHDLVAVIASTGQGRTIRDNTKQLGLAINSGFAPIEPGKQLLVRGDLGVPSFEDGNFKIKVVHPNAQRLRDLQIQWDADLKTAKDKGDNGVIIAALTDKSPFNLSSIVCIVEMNGKRILLTGDARADDILMGLKENDLLDGNGKAHFDILKMPHHGSDANMTPDFLEAITADHYVISANGKHHNPDEDTLNMFMERVKKGTLYFTNHDGEYNLKEKLDVFSERLSAMGSHLQPSFPQNPESSTLINLIDKVDY